MQNDFKTYVMFRQRVQHFEADGYNEVYLTWLFSLCAVQSSIFKRAFYS